MVGASSGIGGAMARQLGARGVRVALIARRGDRLEEIARDIRTISGEDAAPVFEHDVRNLTEVPSIFQQAVTLLGGLDLVVYAAGIMPPIGSDQYPTEIDADIIATNLSGAVAWLNAAADRFGRAGSGTIIGISSVAGDRGRRQNIVYSGSKAALSSYLASLRVRLARRGVTVLTAKPGFVRTQLFARQQLKPLLPVISAERAAAAILLAAIDGKRVVYVPAWWRCVMAVVRAIPAPLFERLNI